MLISTNSRECGFFFGCMYCVSYTTSQPTFPITLHDWSDLPLPPGWEMRLFIDERVSDKPELHAVCPTCAKLNDVAIDELHGRSCRARDVVEYMGRATLAGRGRGSG